MRKSGSLGDRDWQALLFPLGLAVVVVRCPIQIAPSPGRGGPWWWRPPVQDPLTQQQQGGAVLGGSTGQHVLGGAFHCVSQVTIMVLNLCRPHSVELWGAGPLLKTPLSSFPNTRKL